MAEKIAIELCDKRHQNLTQALLDFAHAEGVRTGCTVQETFIAMVSVAMHFNVDRRQGDVDQAEREVIIITEMVAAQFREWPLEERLLREESVN